MGSNLPYGVTEATFGAPWNDQTYCVEFVLVILIDNLRFETTKLTSWFTLTGPYKYDDEDLLESAMTAIYDDFRPQIIDNDCQIEILNINEE